MTLAGYCRTRDGTCIAMSRRTPLAALHWELVLRTQWLRAALAAEHECVSDADGGVEAGARRRTARCPVRLSVSDWSGPGGPLREFPW